MVITLRRQALIITITATMASMVRRQRLRLLTVATTIMATKPPRRRQCPTPLHLRRWPTFLRLRRSTTIATTLQRRRR